MNARSNSEAKIGKIPPIWVPDTQSDSCQECGNKFSFLQRRHHCRACGRLLCSDCSKYQAPLEYLAGCHARVCHSCAQTLKTPRKSKEFRKTKSLNDFDEIKENISKLIRSQQLAEAHSMDFHVQVWISSSFTTYNYCFRTRKCLQGANENEDQPTISSLPLELLSRILEYLNFEDKRECRLVSRVWCSAVSMTDFSAKCCVHFNKDTETRDQTLEKYFCSEHGDFKHFLFTGVQIDSFWTVETCSNIQTLILKDSEV